MNIRSRLRMIRLAQVTPSIPTDQVAATAPIPPPPPDFQASAIYPGIRIGFASNSITIIDELVSLLNIALHYTTAGAINILKLRSMNFIFDASQSPSVDQRNLMNFSKKIFTTLLNSGQPFVQKLDATKIEEMVDTLLASQELNQLSQVNPSGLLATKIPGNLKTTITNYLNYLKRNL